MFCSSFHDDLFKKEKPYGRSVKGPHTKSRARVEESSAGSNATALLWFCSHLFLQDIPVYLNNFHYVTSRIILKDWDS